MKTEIFADYSAFQARKDIKINGVTTAFVENNPDWQALTLKTSV